jgi:DNA helicase II / ATP-dependent DNA helicase PcrA
MDISDLLSGLNAHQREAVAAKPGHYLVLAGAGSGKTSVLTKRIAYLCEAEGVWPHAVLAVTFTNKAAAEMRHRMESLLNQPHRGLWIGTFHGLANKLLRLHVREAGLLEGFQILDADDQLRLLKRVIADMGLDCERFVPKQAVWLINAWKDEGLRADAIQSGSHRHEPIWIDIYRSYEAACKRSNVVDFAELLLRCQELFLAHPALLAHYQNRFTHLLVDEFQDTNTLQYAWIRLLAGSSAQVFVVGDDDQSIYSWRGARVEHMQRFISDFAGAQTIRLEQNYRSTGTILAAANALIANNDGRLGKALWTDAGEGGPIQVFSAYDDQEEARYVVEKIQKTSDAGGASGALKAHAILYRSNAQSRLFEEALMQKGLPYRVYGGLRFFERAEIKDALSYLRLLENQEDDVALERALATPPKGFGEKTLEALRSRAKSGGLSLFAAIVEALGNQAIGGKAKTGAHALIELLEHCRRNAREQDLGDLIDTVLIKSGLNSHYQREDRAEEGRADNLAELVSTARRFNPPLPDLAPGEEAPVQTPLQQFLAYAALEAGEHQSKAWEDSVQLMTLHSAKGLEFPFVYLVGVEEGLFPTQRASEAGDVALEEERRLAYVGITRAREVLSISHAESRRRHGQYELQKPSRFIGEIPQNLLHQIRAKPRARPGYSGGYGSTQHSYPSPRQRYGASAFSGIKLGGRVRHPTFGEGLLISAEGEGAYVRVEVKFDGVGIKWLQLASAGLSAV